MSRFRLCLGALSVSAALFGTTAFAAMAEQQSAAVTLNQSVESGLRDAQAKRAARDFSGAIRVLSQLMLVAADDPRVVGEYGKVLVQQGRARDAIDFLGRATQLEGGDWSLYSALGVAQDQTGDFDGARFAYERALALKPGETVVLNNYAMSRALAGDLVEARRLIAEASAGAKDERIARNVRTINSLTPKAAAMAHTAPPAPHIAAAPKAATPTILSKPLGVPRTLTPAEGKTVMMQAVPADPKAGPVNAKAKPVRKAAVTPKKSPDGIPSLRLANDRP